MEMGLYAIYDRVAEEYGPLFEAINDGIALRNFRHYMEQLKDYEKDDYWLYYLGQYDRKEGEIRIIDEKVRVEGPSKE